MARLLLVVMLAFGVLAMHTVGHPGSASGTAITTSAQAPSEHAAAVDMAPAAVAVTDMLPSGEHSTAASHDSATEMSMAFLCVAVLSVWLLVGLLRAVLARRPDRLTRLRSQTVALLGPSPPPRKPDLTRLSVLRI
ncbi:DUF6153 family protein [Streptomyces lavendulocolor]|uniref:DUF6153 family protein n=1 Tax=Streptomyces lavendulocolor TaxID=67316 RepID=UPI003406689F